MVQVKSGQVIVRCPNCGRQDPADSIDLHPGVELVCGSCGYEFRFAEQLLPPEPKLHFEQAIPMLNTGSVSPFLSGLQAGCGCVIGILIMLGIMIVLLFHGCVLW